MATDPIHIDPTAYLKELITQASPDLMRQVLQTSSTRSSRLK